MDRLKVLEDRLRPLMVAALAGDAGAYDRLLRELTPYLRSYFSRRAQSSLAAHVEDLVQETLLAIHRHRATYDPQRPLTAWTHAIARYKLIDLARRTGRRSSVPIDDVSDFLADERSETSEAMARRDIDVMLSGLPERTRDLIRRVKLDGQSLAQVSSATGLSETAVKVAVHRGVKTLIARFGGAR